MHEKADYMLSHGARQRSRCKCYVAPQGRTTQNVQAVTACAAWLDATAPHRKICQNLGAPWALLVASGQLLLACPRAVTS
jgi:hypothetical protein